MLRKFDPAGQGYCAGYSHLMLAGELHSASWETARTANWIATTTLQERRGHMTRPPISPPLERTTQRLLMRTARLTPALPATPRRRTDLRVTNATQHPPDAGAGFCKRRSVGLGLLSSFVGFLSLEEKSDAGPFLLETGGRGPLAEEEARLLEIRVRKEKEFDEEVMNSKEGKFCATPFGVDVVGITELVALIGALVGGITARRRKQELEQLNERLRKINMSLRQNARYGIVYAPGLTYAPTGDLPTASTPSTAQGTEFQAQSTATAVLGSVDEELSEEHLDCREALKTGKKLLKEQNPSAAMVRFEKALMLARGLRDKTQERRAVRGLAASARLLGEYRAAIKHLQRVLEISDEVDDHVGDSDAYGTIADIYTDMGEFEKAAEFYDRYISRMNTDGPV